MQRSLLCALLWVASLAATTPAFAWTSAPARNPDNGHYYAFFNGADDGDSFGLPAMPFAAALTRAASMSHLGVPGHLATITSQAEQDFVLKQYKVPRSSPFKTWDYFWLAASDAAVEGEWRWITGTEVGEIFWRGSADSLGNVTGQSFGYQNWTKSVSGSEFYEPNNLPSNRSRNPEGEDYLALYLNRLETTSRPSFWNDVIGLDDGGGFSPRLAIVEFSPVPEPASGALIASAVLAFAAFRRRGKSEVPR
jgi:hypothetical protein